MFKIQSLLVTLSDVFVAMTNDLGRRIKTDRTISTSFNYCLNEAPMAGDHFAVYEDEKAARAAGEERAKRALMKQRQQTHRVSLDNLFDTLKAGEMKLLMLLSRLTYKVQLKPWQHLFLRLMLRGFV